MQLRIYKIIKIKSLFKDIQNCHNLRFKYNSIFKKKLFKIVTIVNNSIFF